MSDKLTIEELKMKNELLKNKTEKLKLVRNIVAVVSISLSLIVFILSVNAKSTGSYNKQPTTIDSNATINNNSIESQNLDSQKIEDKDDDLEDGLDD